MTILEYIILSNHKSLIEANPLGCNVKKVWRGTEGSRREGR